MQVGVMITNGGPHSVEKWAEQTSGYIVNIAESIATEKRGAAIKLQAAVIDILEGHHHTIQHGERAKIKEHGHARLQHDLHHDDHVNVDEAVAEIVAAATGTPWEADFNKPEFAASLKLLLVDHYTSNAFIERSWHADRNADAPEAQAFHKQFRGE